MPPNTEKPNLLFVFSDQHRWCDLGCYGNPAVISPHLDLFSQTAMRFELCVSNSPVCVPARGSLLTGLLPVRHRAITNDLPVRSDVFSIAHGLNNAGYHTGYIGKWHLGGVPRERFIPATERLGFEEWKVCNCNHSYQSAYYYDEENRRVEIDGYEPVAQTDLAIDFIQRNRGNPWALVLSWGPPHDPYFEQPERYRDMYAEQGLALRPNFKEPVIYTQERHLTQAEVLKNYRGYYAHITALDEQFGRLLRTLDDNGLGANTLVVYTSDHGDMLGSQGLTNKQLPYDESIRVPLLARLPGKTGVGVNSSLLGLVDLPVSLLALLDLPVPDGLDGQDLSHLFIDAATQGLNACYLIEYTACHQAVARGEREWRGLRTPRYTFARTSTDEGWLLFDNLKDPYQQNNLVNDVSFSDLKNSLRTQLDEFIQEHDALLPWDEFLRKFGFLEGWNRSQAYFGLPTLG